MSTSEPFEPELNQRSNESSVRDTEGEDQPDVFLPQEGSDQDGPDEAEQHLYLPEHTPFRTPDPDQLRRD
jgi:hypothetical protein